METYIFENTREIRKERENLSSKLNVNINVKGKNVTIDGPAVKEYEASLVMEAMQAGFSAKKALDLLNEEFIFRKLKIKDYTRKKNLKEVRGRIIGKQGKTKRTIENIANCEVIVKENELSFICPAGEVEEVTTGIINLIRGTKQSNIYSFLEKMNRERKKHNYQSQ
jgi:ribosomal RNA assembly protein